MTTQAIPDGLEPISPLPRGVAEEAVDRTLRTTNDAILFTAAVGEALGPRGYECEWVKPGGDRRFYAYDADRPGWIVAQAILELSLDVPPPPPGSDEVLLPDGTRMKFGLDRPKAQPEGPNQRSAELRLIEGERVAQWAYDAVGQVRERMRGRGDGDSAQPFLRDTRRLDRDQQRPHALFLRGDLDAWGHSPRELAEKFADLDFRAFSKVRVWVPHPMPGGPALAARRAVWELRRASREGRWSYPAAGWVVVDGYVGDVKATGATFESAFEQFQHAARVHNPVPRDSRRTREEIARVEREYEEFLEEQERTKKEPPPPAESEVEVSPGRMVVETEFRMWFVPPVRMPFPPQRPECVPAVAIPLPEPPALPDAWRAAGFRDVIRLIDEEGTVAHGFLAPGPEGSSWFVGEAAARHLDPATLEEQARAVESEADRHDLEVWGGAFPGMGHDSPWHTSHFTVLADAGRRIGPLVRNGWSGGKGPDTNGFEPPQAFSVVWSRRVR